MLRHVILTLALVAGAFSMAGCAPLVGAGVAIVADDQAEKRGGNLF